MAKKNSLLEYGVAPLSYGADSSLVQLKAIRNFRTNLNDSKQVRGKSSLDKMFQNEVLSPNKRHDNYVKVGATDLMNY